jgi:hypothetical protein
MMTPIPILIHLELCPVLSPDPRLHLQPLQLISMILHRVCHLLQLPLLPLFLQRLHLLSDVPGTIFALRESGGHHLRSVDISNTFTNGDLEEEIYMLQPEGFHEGGPNKVCRLRKSLYGLKQAARQWNKKLHSFLTDRSSVPGI